MILTKARPICLQDTINIIHVAVTFHYQTLDELSEWTSCEYCQGKEKRRGIHSKKERSDVL